MQILRKELDPVNGKTDKNGMRILGIILIGFVIASCQQTGSAPKLQSHLAAAQNSSQQTGQHIQSIKGHLDTADYKGSRAQKVLNEGVNQ